MVGVSERFRLFWKDRTTHHHRDRALSFSGTPLSSFAGTPLSSHTHCTHPNAMGKGGMLPSVGGLAPQGAGGSL